ncbi:2,4-dihydroxyhept-2-ene-1,7-dioic acid aldolase [Cylindrospermopsis raciborskii S07]|uniref:HpcH/HpaI aldolase family protein n=1 Tax=Cylindrospermopsis raciborskii TaxID=77022 RepID=UPI000C9E448C|nr:aldolase/citrate lyase family protein [Cylindrospermopsis raciborskii]PNK05544.1 2,4-dihydroxyhept-2-ene-1,7-dioic acid aldolase [Cylindrospermopsis raciborskii S10]PNK08659.1 2,4-dihydroxyhept-2-ene-1,7-dioic acid aldolase [Cylindrospermopsis raciborskii S07]PNK10265.1 2,4-dihydroxyhept-2-ene-1,7-dioic acid aldolase [Cylindrospermopsis raciborskii S14]PNK15138.1 2,4-dihydroxyhept-2-ene-1,7-dioic acid aldolase [Cylindrospermopsis raciborskii S06]PNK17421.1 2,4-dihydroxyhept-2-ene-1,7-dioic 
MNRQIAIQQIREKLESGGVSLGSWMQIPHASVAEIMGQAGYDWVAVDMEHGSISIHQLPDLFRSLELGNTLPLARIAEGTTKECKQVLDAGAGGVIVPMVETGEQLLAVRNACRWPPGGTRGVGFSRANLFGEHFDTYREEAQAPLLVAMIEHQQAVINLDEILDVDGLDAILIGPYDLSASMGLTAQFEHPAFREAMAQILEKATLSKVPAGVHVVQPSKSELEQRISEGYRFLAYSIDGVMLSVISKRVSSSNSHK